MKRVLQNIALFLGFFLIALIAVEFFIRAFFPHIKPSFSERSLWVADSQLGWKHPKNMQTMFYHQDFAINVQSNENGFRNQLTPLAKKTKPRLLIIGDSYTWGFGVEEEERFSDIIQKRHPEWEIINAGMPCYGSDQSLIYLENIGIHYQPDAVLYVLFSNDFTDNSKSLNCWYKKPYFIIKNGELVLKNYPVPQSEFHEKLARQLLKTHVGSLFINVFKILRGETSQADSASHYQSLEERENKLTELIIRRIERFSRKNNINYFQVSMPLSFWFTSPETNKKRRQLLEDMAEELSYPHMTLNHTFGNYEGKTKFDHDSHWNALGNYYTAIEVEAFLQKNNLLVAKPLPEANLIGFFNTQSKEKSLKELQKTFAKTQK